MKPIELLIGDVGTLEDFDQKCRDYFHEGYKPVGNILDGEKLIGIKLFNPSEV